MLITLWTIRAACAFYLCALAAWLTGRERFARLCWVTAYLLYLGHVAAAFHFIHGWSHRAALEETARQTFELFGVRWGGGLYFNYLFTAAWGLDLALPGRPRWLGAAIHGFLAFMFVNGAIVFASGWTRWLSMAAAIALCLLWRLRLSRARRESRRQST